MVEFTPEAATAVYRWVEDALDPGSAVADGPVWRTESGSPGAVQI